MSDVGYRLGPSFQKHLEYESLSGQRASRSIVSLTEPSSNHSQSDYPIHPACIDGFLQACGPALWNGDRASMHSVLVPAVIDDVLICPKPKASITGIANITSTYNGVGDTNDTKNYSANVTVYDKDTGLLLFQASKLRTFILDTHAASHTEGKFCQLTWKPDITFMSQSHLSQYLGVSTSSNSDSLAVINQTIDLIVHKKPNLKVCEAVMVPRVSSSVWSDTDSNNSGVRSTCEAFKFVSSDARALLSAKEARAAHASSADFSVLDLASSPDAEFKKAQFDLLIVRYVGYPHFVVD